MKSFKSYITELFDTPINFDIGKKGDAVVYSFTTKKNNKVDIFFYEEGEIVFSVNGKEEHKDLKDLEVISGVVQGVEEYITKAKPNFVFFSANEDLKIPLYNKFSTILQKKGYKREETEKNDYVFRRVK